MRQRRRLIASRKAGFSAADSDIALIVLKPKDWSFAQYAVRNQTPSHEAEDARWFGRVLADGCDLLSGSNVPAGPPGRIVIETEVIPHVAFFRREPIASAHGQSD